MANSNLGDEVWDDTALLTTWDEAVAEYKKYHTLAAKGEQVPIGELAEPPEAPETYSAKLNRKKEEKLALANGAEAPTSSGTTTTDVRPQIELSLKAEVVEATAAAPSSSNGAATVPQHLMSSVQDEGLKNLMMSWYYAGYYTGLYEGKQQGLVPAQGTG
ncbi:hypothetical protein B0A48_11159 [Cryoendolithus antarcticus]|uniref:Survival Motor Neuron Gemin2-binding domain-containing protein n=1 Tax=Cryoendolithus antarcticus TaxID=1507870 RepID=A0A1V8SUP2_9PEZI|nr:hypothetical protein B0A48_11159 [Cryoendolithus antarcticus]